MVEQNKKFYETKEEIIKLVNLKRSKLTRETRDNSFVSFLLRKLIGPMSKDLENAIQEQEVKIDSENFNEYINAIRRYISEVGDIIWYKNLDRGEIRLFTQTNLLLSNWIKMVKGLDEEVYSSEDLEKVKKQISRLNDILDGNLTLRDLIEMNKSLINKAQEIYYNAPTQFKASESFIKAMHKAMEE